MGIDISALRDANLLIDDPDEWFRRHNMQNIYGLVHDDDRIFAMNIVRSILRDLHGEAGVLAADLHYVLDYIERLLDPEMSKWMLEKTQHQSLFPSRRWGFVHRYKGIWYPSARDQNTIPITAYCNVCKGVRKPVNSPFCNECKVHTLDKEDISRKALKDSFLQMLAKKIEERKIDIRVVDFVGKNFNYIIMMIIEDRRRRGLNSINIGRY